MANERWPAGVAGPHRCPFCGFETMEIVGVKRERVGPLFAKNTQWAVDLVCPQCSRRHGTAMADIRQPMRSPLNRAFALLARRLLPSRERGRPQFLNRIRSRDGTINVRELLKHAQFQVLAGAGELLGLQGSING
jgi:hypothetical protein